MKKVIYTLLAIIIIGILLVLLYIFAFRQIAALDSVYVRSIDVTDDAINIEADFAGSSMGFAGYRTDFQNKQLRVKILMRNGFQFGKLHSPSFSLPNDFKDVQEIYLEGVSPSEIRLLWSK